MPSKMPPVPPANRSPKGPGAKPATPKDTQPAEKTAKNLEEEGRHGNIKQNTTHQGYQQDR
jgi:hypothetical protein